MASEGRQSWTARRGRRSGVPPTWPPNELAEATVSTARWNGDGSAEPDLVEAGIERLRADAVRIARADAECSVPAMERSEPPESEFDLKERCRAFVQRLRDADRRRAAEEASRLEETITAGLGHAALKVDRFERLTNDLTRLRVRRESRKREVDRELASERPKRARGIPTKVYVGAISFLGIVEFLANAPVFSSLLPRDPLTERQIRLLGETSDGWIAGAERVLAHILLRPDAALLAAGVIVFLLVTAHFFGHALRSLVIQQDRLARKDTVAPRSALENLVPIVITGIGLALALGVLFEARVMLGGVGQERYVQDMAQVEELRRQAGWLRTEGDLLAANQLTNRADDMEAAALALREYSGAMSRMSFQILLLNLTLVLCAIAVAYFHTRDSRIEKFNEDAFEEERKELVDAAETTAAEIATGLAELMRDVQRLRTTLSGGDAHDLKPLVHQLEAVVALYRAENGRARGLDPGEITAFRKPISLGFVPADLKVGHRSTRTQHLVREYGNERSAVQERFEVVRARFSEEVRG
ncbi:MAG: hypothetical protein ACRD2Z_02405 [Thermoanaerobaculia bacterium]